MYWSDWGSDGRIEKAGMDGSQRRTIISDLKWPNGLSVDFDLQRLYWTDAGSRTIEHSDLFGGNRQVCPTCMCLSHKILTTSVIAVGVFYEKCHEFEFIHVHCCSKESHWKGIECPCVAPSNVAVRTYIPRFVCLQVLLSRDLSHPFGLTVFEQYVYWTDWDTGSIERAHKVDGSSRRTVASGLDSLMDLHMFHRDRPDGKQYRTVKIGNVIHVFAVHMGSLRR